MPPFHTTINIHFVSGMKNEVMIKIENVQKKMTMMLAGLEGWSQQERLTVFHAVKEAER